MSYRPKDINERILHRLKIAHGHLGKVISMVEKQEYCIDIIHQSQAVQEALKKTDRVILENYLQICVPDALKDGKNESVIKEIMSIFKKVKSES